MWPRGRTVGGLVAAAHHMELQSKAAPAAAHRSRSRDLEARVDIQTFS